MKSEPLPANLIQAEFTKANQTISVYHPCDNILRHSPVPDKTRNRNLVRKHPGSMEGLTKKALWPGLALVRLPSAQGCTVLGVPCTPWENFRSTILFLGFCVFYKNIVRIWQSFQTKGFAHVQKTSRVMLYKWKNEVLLWKNCFILFFFSDKLNHFKTYIFKNSSFLILLNMFVEKIPSTSIKFIRFHIQRFIMLDFWWNA